MKPYIIMNSGAGAVGKTSVVIEACKIAAEKKGVSAAFMPSPTRSTYDRLGISTERAATEMSVEEQFRLQDAIHEDYYAAVDKFVTDETAKGTQVLFIDRCPLDHVSYLIHNLSRHMTLKQVNEHLDHAIQVMVGLVPSSRAVHVQYFPFPDYWHTYETESSDGFRYDSGGKNFMWDAILHSMLLKAEMKILATEDVVSEEFFVAYWPENNMSIEERANYLLECSFRDD